MAGVVCLNHTAAWKRRENMRGIKLNPELVNNAKSTTKLLAPVS